MHIRGLAVQQSCTLSACITSDSISFPDIYAKSAKCYAGLRSSGCNFIINVHCSGESASKIGEFINNLKFLSIHSDGLGAKWRYAGYFGSSLHPPGREIWLLS